MASPGGDRESKETGRPTGKATECSSEASQKDGLRQAATAKPSHGQQDDSAGRGPKSKYHRKGVITKRRLLKEPYDLEATPLMGRARRNPINAEVEIPISAGFKNYHLVDLYERPQVSDILEVLMADEYLFKPVPLRCRTWVYHDLYREQMTIEMDENAMLKAALREQVCDAEVNVGAWSPAMCLLPMNVALAVTADYMLLACAMSLLLGVVTASKMMNTARWYKHLRVATIIPRYGVYVFVVISFLTSSSGGLAVAGFLLATVLILVDIIGGDLKLFLQAQLQCCWTITHVLRNRVFVCHRSGAAWYEDRFGSRGNVSETVVGFAPWAHDLMLLAEIQGMIVELRPLNGEDWENLYTSVILDEEIPPTVLAMNVYSEELPTYQAVRDEEMRAAMGPAGSPKATSP